MIGETKGDEDCVVIRDIAVTSDSPVVLAGLAQFCDEFDRSRMMSIIAR